MKFRKINESTINCIITQDDLKKHGIDLDDLFDRKKNAVEFIKAIIAKGSAPFMRWRRSAAFSRQPPESPAQCTMIKRPKRTI